MVPEISYVLIIVHEIDAIFLKCLDMSWDFLQVHGASPSYAGASPSYAGASPSYAGASPSYARKIVSPPLREGFQSRGKPQLCRGKPQHDPLKAQGHWYDK